MAVAVASTIEKEVSMPRVNSVSDRISDQKLAEDFVAIALGNTM